MKLVTAKEMKALDVQAQNDYAMPGILLMDNAAQAVAEAVHEALTALEGERVVIFCGGGITAAMAWARHAGCKAMA